MSGATLSLVERIHSKKLYLPRCLYQLMITRRGAPQNPETTPFPSLRD
jgi:hypothetical protein